MQRCLWLFLSVSLLLGLMACQDEGATPTAVTGNDVAATSSATRITEITPDATLDDLFEEPIEVTVEVTEMPTAVPIATTEPTPTATPEPKHLAVCIGSEPDSLYVYGTQSYAKTMVRQALFEDPYTTLTYDYQPWGLAALPSVEDGTAVIVDVNIERGERVMDVDGRIVVLDNGVTILTSDGETITYGRDITGTVTMPQQQVEFTFNPLVWSDGTPLNASDSVYSFQVAADPASRSDKIRIDHTARYEAVDELTVRWSGVPGYSDREFFRNVWTPLPQHQFERYSPTGLLSAIESNQSPLSNGPVMLDSWVPGEAITLVKNPYYYRQVEGLPRVDSVTFKFVADSQAAIDALQAGECHIATHDTVFMDDVAALEAAEAIVPYLQTGAVFEQISFSVDPVIAYGVNRTDWFEDVQVRQAFALCTDRQAMVDEVLLGRSQPMNSYSPQDHPLYAADLQAWSRDVAGADQLLTSAGYVDQDGDGVRENANGEPFAINLLTMSESTSRLRMAEMFANDLAECGVAVTVTAVPSPEFFTDGPLGPLFGRQFDLALFAWRLGMEPSCQLYATASITGDPADGLGGWDNVNVTGWSDPEFDAACNVARTAVFNSEEYVQNHQAALQIFNEQLPAIPLFPRLNVAATRSEVENFALDATHDVELWNIAQIDLRTED